MFIICIHLIIIIFIQIMGNKSSSCIFCDLFKDDSKVLDKDSKYFAFHDISKGSAR